MHRYYHSVLPNWNPAWMLIPLAVWAILLSVALSLPVAYSEPGVRHALPLRARVLRHRVEQWPVLRVCSS